MLLSRTRTRARAGSIALATSALLLMVFPLVRPFFPLDVGEPARTLDVGGVALVSASWFVAHLMGTLAFVLLPFGLLALYAKLADDVTEPRALRVECSVTVTTTATASDDS